MQRRLLLTVLLAVAIHGVAASFDLEGRIPMSEGERIRKERNFRERTSPFRQYQIPMAAQGRRSVSVEKAQPCGQGICQSRITITSPTQPDTVEGIKLVARDAGSQGFVMQASKNNFVVLTRAEDVPRLAQVSGIVSVDRPAPGSKLAYELKRVVTEGLDADEKGAPLVVLCRLACEGMACRDINGAWVSAINANATASLTVGMELDDTGLLKATVPQDRIRDVVLYLAEQEQLISAEREEKVKITNIFANKIVQSGRMLSYNADGSITSSWTYSSALNVVPHMWNKNIDGTGEIVAMGDTGLDVNSAFFRDQTGADYTKCATSYSGVSDGTFDCDAVTNHRKIVAYRKFTYSDFEDYSGGHGSHVAGSAFASVVSPAPSCTMGTIPVNGVDFNGAAPGAKMVVDDVGDSSGGLMIPNALDTAYFPYSYLKGARIHTNSWGPAYPTAEYSTHSQTLDQFMYSNDDFLVLFAAGNDGENDAPYGIGGGSASKNAVVVGASQNELSFPGADGTKYTRSSAGAVYTDSPNGLAYFSSRGPAKFDFRIKPDVVCPGQQIASVYGNTAAEGAACKMRDMSGTSMATPVCAGTSALIRQYFREGHFGGTGFPPSASLVKAVLLQSGTPMTYLKDVGGTLTRIPMGEVKIPNTRIGYGLVDLSTVLTFSDTPGSLKSYFYNSVVIKQGEMFAHCFSLVGAGSAATVKATLVWTDPAGAVNGDMALVHDLDLVVVEPRGTFTYGNNFTTTTETHPEHPYIDVVNNNEQITIRAAADGTYTVRVRGTDVTDANGQKYSLVVTGTGGTSFTETACDGAEPACPNDCSGFGDCSAGACVCASTHYGPSCSMAVPVADTGRTITMSTSYAGWSYLRIEPDADYDTTYPHRVIMFTSTAGNPWVFTKTSTDYAFPSLDSWDSRHQEVQTQISQVVTTGTVVALYAHCCSEVNEATVSVMAADCTDMNDPGTCTIAPPPGGITYPPTPAPTPPPTLICNGCVNCNTFEENEVTGITDGTGDYPSNSQCLWIVAPPDSSANTVGVTFSQLKTEQDWDFVTLYNCANIACDERSRTELTAFSGDWSSIINSYGLVYPAQATILAIEFTSDGDIGASGFDISTSAYFDATCRGIETFTGSTGQITDGDGDYGEFKDCWFIFAPADPEMTQLSVTFTMFDVEFDWDWVDIYDCTDTQCSTPTLITSLTGAIVIPSTTYGSTRIMGIHFTSDYMINGAGFVGSFSATTSTPAPPPPPPTSGAPWMDSAVQGRFDLPECEESRSWDEIIPAGPSLEIVMGGVGNVAAGDESWKMWACFGVHSCVGAVGGAAGDSMCYAFHETTRTFWPWGLNSELGLCGAARRTGVTSKTVKSHGISRTPTTAAERLRGVKHFDASDFKVPKNTRSTAAAERKGERHAGSQKKIIRRASSQKKSERRRMNL